MASLGKNSVHDSESHYRLSLIIVFTGGRCEWNIDHYLECAPADGNKTPSAHGVWTFRMLNPGKGVMALRQEGNVYRP